MFKKCNQVVVYVAFIFLFMMFFFISYQVPMSGDDFFYYQFSRSGLWYFLKMNVAHYFMANGRIAVHLLLSCFLALPKFWQSFFNASFMTSIALAMFIIVKSTDDSKESECQHDTNLFIIIILLFSHLNILMTRQSVYWMTGSLNYVFPMAIFLLYWRRLQIRDNRYFVVALAFLSGSLTEQISLMTVGLTLMFLVDELWRHRKLNRGVLKCLIATVMGALTLYLAPANMNRLAQTAIPQTTIFELVKTNAFNHNNTIFFSEAMVVIWLGVFAINLVTLLQWCLSKRKYHKVHFIVLCIHTLTFIKWFSAIENNKFYYDIAELSSTTLYLYIAIILSTVAVVTYIAVVFYTSGKTLALFAVCLGFGSQLMMIISPVYGLRNTWLLLCMMLFYVMTLSKEQPFGYFSTFFWMLFTIRILHYPSVIKFFAAVLLPILLLSGLIWMINHKKYRYNSGVWLVKPLITALSIYLVIVIAMGYAYQTQQGFTVNRQIELENRLLANKFMSEKKDGLNKVIVQKKYTETAYIWAMPYNNPYYDSYYKRYLELDDEVLIDWQ